MKRAVAGLCAAAVAACLVACGGSAGGGGAVVAAADAPIATVHRKQCGRCHAPPEPRSHTREELQAAFGRHGKRVRLSQEEWQAMVDYLAPPAT